MHVGFLDDCCQCSLGLPSGLQKRGELARVPDPRDRKFNTPNPCVPGPLAVAIALTYAPWAALVARGAYVLFYLHLHEHLGEHPDTFLQELCIALYLCLAQQLLKSYPRSSPRFQVRVAEHWSVRRVMSSSCSQLSPTKE